MTTGLAPAVRIEAATTRRSGRLRAGAAALSCLLLLLPLAALPAQLTGEPDAVSLEKRVKAASLFRFLGYIDWPPAQHAARDFYVIGVVDADDIADELVKLATGRRVNERNVTIRRMTASDPMSEVDELFVGITDLAGIDAIAQRLRNRPVLVVTQTDALPRGSMINLRIVEDRVRFEVALDTLEQAGLRASSRLLSVALQVFRPGVR